jgi:hypothetical protein
VVSELASGLTGRTASDTHKARSYRPTTALIDYARELEARERRARATGRRRPRRPGLPDTRQLAALDRGRLPLARQVEVTCRVPKLGSLPEKSSICRQDANFGTRNGSIFGSASSSSRSLAVLTHAGGSARICASSSLPEASSFFSFARASRISFACCRARRHCSRDLPGTAAGAVPTDTQAIVRARSRGRSTARPACSGRSGRSRSVRTAGGPFSTSAQRAEHHARERDRVYASHGFWLRGVLGSDIRARAPVACRRLRSGLRVGCRGWAHGRQLAGSRILRERRH